MKAFKSTVFTLFVLAPIFLEGVIAAASIVLCLLILHGVWVLDPFLIMLVGPFLVLGIIAVLCALIPSLGNRITGKNSFYMRTDAKVRLWAGVPSS
jgi:hypothetical protein